MAAINFKKGFDAWVNANQKVWAHDRTKSLGASEVFGCLRKAFFGKHGYEKDSGHEQSWGALRRGDLIENEFVVPATRWILENLTTDADILYAGEKQKTFHDGPLSATPDGLVIYADDDALAAYGIPSLGSGGDPEHESACFNYEIKSIDPRVNLKEEKDIHHGQVQVQMGLTREQTTWKPKYALIIYIDASFFDDIEIFIVEYDENTYQAAKKRAATVFEKDMTPAMIMAEGKIDGSCKYCPYTTACAAVTQGSMPGEDTAAGDGDLPEDLLEEFISLFRSEREASAMKKEVEQDQKEASERLKEFLRKTGVRRVELGELGVKVSMSWNKGRKMLDTAAMKEDGIDLEKYEKIGNGHERLSLSEKGAMKADAD